MLRTAIIQEEDMDFVDGFALLGSRNPDSALVNELSLRVLNGDIL